jgi:cytochrome c-type biogenesis protein CcmH/NrfF
VYPRTLEQAFGERGPVVGMDDEPPMDWQDKIVLWLAPVAVVFVIVLIALEK